MIKNKIEAIFSYPKFTTPWGTYFSDLNEAGKITAKSTLDMVIVILETLEQQEETLEGVRIQTEDVTNRMSNPPEPSKKHQVK